MNTVQFSIKEHTYCKSAIVNIIRKVSYIYETECLNHDLWHPDDISSVIQHNHRTAELFQVLHTTTCVKYLSFSLNKSFFQIFQNCNRAK